MAGALFQGQHIRQSVGHPQVGIAEHEAGLVVFDLADHLGLLVNGLGDIDKGDAALFRQGNAHLFTGDGLHDGGNHGDVHGQGALFPFAVLDHRGLERDVGGDTVSGGVAGDQQVFTEGVGGFSKKVCHFATSFKKYKLKVFYHKKWRLQ